MTDEKAIELLKASISLIEKAHVVIVNNEMRKPFVNGRLSEKLGTAYALIGDSIKIVRGELPG